MSVIFLLGGTRVSCIGVERHHRFAAVKLRVRVIVGIYRHGRDAMAQMWLSCCGPLRCGCRASRLIWLVSSKGLFSPVILVCHIARLLSLLSIVCYFRQWFSARGNSSNSKLWCGSIARGMVGGARRAKRGMADQTTK